MSERVMVTVDGGELPAYLWLPPAGRGPGVVLFQEIFGLSPYIHRRAADLAALGYVVLAPQLFWRQGVEAVADGPDMLTQGLELVTALDWPAAVADGVAAVEALRARDEIDGPVGVLGFCFGGGLAYAVASTLQAATPVDALVSYYGSALPMLVDATPVVAAPSLHHFGSADSYLDGPTVAHIREVVTTNPDCEFYVYEGADHAFDNPDFVLYSEAASHESWPTTAEFLSRVLPVT